MRLFLLFGVFGALFLLYSCKKFKPADSAFFVRSGTVSVSTKPHEGTANQKITDLWLYVNGQFQGVFPVGNLMPIPNKDQATEINIFAGIKNNGISDTRIFYPFFDFLTIDTLVEAGKVIERPFTFKYKASTTFTWTENFDSNSGYSVKTTKGPSLRKCSPADAFENTSVYMILQGDTNQVEIQSSSDGFSLPLGSSNVYLELNYKCNTGFRVGVIADDGTPMDAITINPQENWNKIYIQLSTAVSTLASSKYKIFISAAKASDDMGTKLVYLDNIKLLYL